MPHPPFRFIHAGDLHLEQPLSGGGEVPEHLREIFIEAPYHAAERVFEAAILEGAAFLILSGDIVQPLLAGPHGLLFLCEQFERLGKKGIGVYWAGGEIDPPEGWPSTLSLPGNVALFPRGRVDEYLVQLAGIPIARILGTSRESQGGIRCGEFRPDSTGLFTAAVAYGEADAAMQTRGINYWALGGRHERTSQSTGPSLIHHPGTPQGRHPLENGIHGCTLVQVDEQNQVRTSSIPCDAARFVSERIVVAETAGCQELETLLRERMRLLRESAPKIHLFVSWTIAGTGGLLRDLRRGRLAIELLEGLRAEFGFDSPAAWSIGMDAECADAVSPQWREEETIRGDFLRAIEQLRINPAEPLDIEGYLCEPHRIGALADAAAIADRDVRSQVLGEAALLGLELLGGEA